mmetsp:Transcript_33798/g.74904  ORF Transcript_33798/g.74904 Transcript_33798/m.74904 type:complete len:237 (-) Transcript_33798:114-824(-)
MALSQVHDVDVVADGSAIWSRVVTTPHAQEITLPQGHLLDVGHQVVGDADRVLTQVTTGVCADGVEVPEQQDAPLLVTDTQVAEHVLLEQLGAAIRADGLEGGVLGDGHLLGDAVHGAGAGEDNILALVLAHDVQQRHSAVEVVVVVLEGLLHGLTHSLEAGKVDDAVVLLLSEELVQQLGIIDVTLDILHLVSLVACKLLHVVKYPREGVAQVVNKGHLAAMLEKHEHRVAGNKA